MALSGRKARNVRSDLRTLRFSFSSISSENTDTWTRTSWLEVSDQNIIINDTYKHYDEIKYGPEAGKVLGKSEGQPLEDHFNDEYQTEGEVNPV